MVLKIKKISYLEFFLFCLLFLPITPNMGYILYFFLIISTIIFKRNFLKNVNIHRKNKIPLLIFFVWIYGVILGVIRGNQLSLLIQNFAGMVLYILFYLFA